jgi:hypothetical protein
MKVARECLTFDRKARETQKSTAAQLNEAALLVIELTEALMINDVHLTAVRNLGNARGGAEDRINRSFGKRSQHR